MFPENRFMELLIIGALALIVIGPKDLPLLMRRLGQFMGRMRAMANEFRASFDELARQSELDELRREVDALRHSATLSDGPGPETSVVDDIKNSLSMQPAPVMTRLPEPELVAPVEPEAAPAVEAATKPARKPRAKAATADPATTAPTKRAPRKSAARAAGPTP